MKIKIRTYGSFNGTKQESKRFVFISEKTTTTPQVITLLVSVSKRHAQNIKNLSSTNNAVQQHTQTHAQTRIHRHTHRHTHTDTHTVLMVFQILSMHK